MKYTLLDLVQTVLSSMDSDEVNSINDTVEAQQVAYLIRSVYYRIASSADLPEHESMFNLDATSASTPVVMTRPSNVSRIDSVKYDKADLDNTDPVYTELKSMSVTDFFDQMYQLSLSEDNVSSFNLTVGTSTVKILYRTDKHPEYYTTFDDNTIIFDSILTDVDANLQSSKTLCKGSVYKTFTLTDNFTPDLDQQQFDLLLNEAKAWAHAELKQMAHPKAEQAARRGWINLQRTKDAIKIGTPLDRLPDYGRRYY